MCVLPVIPSYLETPRHVLGEHCTAAVSRLTSSTLYTLMILLCCYCSAAKRVGITIRRPGMSIEMTGNTEDQSFSRSRYVHWYDMYIQTAVQYRLVYRSIFVYFPRKRPMAHFRLPPSVQSPAVRVSCYSLPTTCCERPPGFTRNTTAVCDIRWVVVPFFRTSAYLNVIKVDTTAVV